jgi:hypothetical protein
MLKYWSHPLRTTATAFPVTTIRHKACQGIDQPTLDIGTIFPMLRLLCFFRSLQRSMAINQWTSAILCLRLHPSPQSMATSFSRVCNSNNKTTITLKQCNPGKHLNSIALPNRPSNLRVCTYSKIQQNSLLPIMPFHHTTYSMLL